MASKYTDTIYITSARLARGYVEAWLDSETDTTATIGWKILCQQKSAALYGQVANGYVDGSHVGYCEGYITSSSSSWKDVCSTSGYATVSKTTAARNVPVTISTRVQVVDGYGSVTTDWAEATCYVPISAKTSYAVKYDANGGSGAPDAQTKWHGTALTLSSTKPTRTGYSFQGWGTSASDTSVDYAAGASYTANAAVTLYAIWKANTYAVSFDANGGSGAPSAVTKTYGVTLTLPTTVPTRTNYNFLGWAASASAATAQYQAGGTFTTEAATTLYAVWELAYWTPKIIGLSADRCDGAGAHDDYGTYVLVTFGWETCQLLGENDAESCSVTAGDETVSLDMGGTGGTVSVVVGGSLSVDSQHAVTVTVADSAGGSTSRGAIVLKAEFPFDVKAGGTGVTMGGPAEEDGFNCLWPARFGDSVTFDKSPFERVAGVIYQYGGGTAPDGFLMCDGSEHSREEYPELFAVIGVIYGEGDGETTFNVPDMRGRVAVGSSDGYELGSTGGKSEVMLTAAIGAVANNAGSIGYIADGYSYYQAGNGATYAIASSQVSGGWNHGTPVTDHGSTDRNTSIMQPYAVTSYIISTGKKDDAVAVAAASEESSGDGGAAYDPYPVGAVYISYTPASPASLFGGTWQQITDKFLRAASNTNTGGSDTHTLTVAQMPSHNHTTDVWVVYDKGSWSDNGDAANPGTTSSTTPFGDTHVNTTYAGGGGSHNNMPAYQNVYVWRRVA